MYEYSRTSKGNSISKHPEKNWKNPGRIDQYDPIKWIEKTW
jgi:hypothetical protein